MNIFQFEQYKRILMLLQLRAEVSQAINLQYKTRRFSSRMTAKEMILCAQQVMKQNIDIIDYDLNGETILRYGIKVQICQIDPFPIHEHISMNKLADITEQLAKTAKETSFVITSILQKLMKYILSQGVGLAITERYHKYLLYFKHINIKEALIFEALSKCQIFYTMVKERKKSGKQFAMDALINLFQNIKARLGLLNAFHESVLPRKQLKFFEKKSTDKKMKNTLFDAVSNRKYKQVKQLVVKGGISIEEPGIIEKTKRQMNCSHRACQLGDLQLCRILDSFNVDWSVREKDGMTPLHFAVQSGNVNVVRFLVEEAKVQIEAKDVQERTPFYFAVTEGDMDVVRYLYEKGADINNKSKLGRSALSKSCYLGLVDVVTFLMGCPGIILTSSDGKGRTALHNAVFGPKGGREGHKFGTNERDSPECTQLLLQNGFDVDHLDVEQNTPLHVSMSSDGIDSIKVLLAFGASLTKINCYEQNPLMTGAKFGHLDSVKYLREQGGSLITKDIFGKNLMLLCAKFRQDEGRAVNEVFYYGADEILAMAKRGEKLENSGRSFITNWQQQIDYTFYELLKQIVRVRTQFKYFCQRCMDNQLSVANLTLEHIKMLLDFVKNSQDQKQFDIVEYILSRRPNNGKLSLTKEQFSAFIGWIISQNSTKLFDFFSKVQGSLRKYLSVEGQYVSLLQYLGNKTLSTIGVMKEKVLTYCLLKLNINWLDYIEEKHYYNIIHLLVRHKKIGTLIQVLKVLSAIKMDFVTNQHIINLLEEERNFKDSKAQGESPLELVLKNMLIHRDREGFDPYNLALLMKDASAIKLLEQKLNKHTIFNKQQFEVKDYSFIVEQDPAQVELFNKGYEIQNQLQAFLHLIETISTRPQLGWYFCALNQKKEDTSQSGVNIDDFKSVWHDVSLRKLWFISTVDDLQRLEQLKNDKIIGLDIEYFYAEGATLISIMQISSLTHDYIIDFLCSAKSHEDYYHFVRAARKYLAPIAYDKSIMKVMHGSDNDLCVIKSVLGFSFLNFADTARIDVQLRKEQNIRGLATLAKEYLGEHMSKDYQVSEWRIRPIPSSMLDYARRDSLVLPFLVIKMLRQLEFGRLKQILMGGCRQARRNRKSSQPLIKSIQAL